MTIDLNPPVRYRIPAQKFLAILESDSCRARSHELWPEETEVTEPDPDTETTTPSPDFRPLSPILDFMSQARWYLQQHGCSSAHYVEITEDGRYQVVKRNLLVDKLQPLLDQYGYPAVQSVLLRYRPEQPPAASEGVSVPVIKEVKLRPGVPGRPPERGHRPDWVETGVPYGEDPDPRGPSSEQPLVPRAKPSKNSGKRDRREYHKNYRQKQKEKLTMVQDTNDLLKEVLEARKTDANPDGTGTPVINDEIQVMVTDVDKITGTDTGVNIITDPDVKDKVSDENPYAIEPEIHTGSETVSDTVTPVVNPDTTGTPKREIVETERNPDPDALRANHNADETPVTQAQPVPDPLNEAKEVEPEPEPEPEAKPKKQPAKKK